MKELPEFEQDVRPGDWWMGCPKCRFHLEPGVAAKPECPDCGMRLMLYKIELQDLLSPRQELGFLKEEDGKLQED